MVPILISPAPAKDEPPDRQKKAIVTIIVAVAQPMGVSYNTHLLWPECKSESDHFKFTTECTPSENAMNAVIMGYNTGTMT